MPRVHLTPTKLPKSFEELVRLHPPAAIHDAVAYANAMEMVNLLTSIPKPSTSQLKYLDTLSVLVEAYENGEMCATPAGADAVDVLSHLLDEHGMNASDLGRLLGDRALGSKILNRQRDLSKAHILRLAERFHVSPATLL